MRSCTCVLEVSILPLFTIFQLDSGTVPTVWYFFFVFHFIITDRARAYPFRPFSITFQYIVWHIKHIRAWFKVIVLDIP
jgi:hypothetical protein